MPRLPSGELRLAVAASVIPGGAVPLAFSPALALAGVVAGVALVVPVLGDGRHAAEVVPRGSRGGIAPRVPPRGVPAPSGRARDRRRELPAPRQGRRGREEGQAGHDCAGVGDAEVGASPVRHEAGRDAELGAALVRLHRLYFGPMKPSRSRQKLRPWWS